MQLEIEDREWYPYRSTPDHNVIIHVIIYVAILYYIIHVYYTVPSLLCHQELIRSIH